MPEGLTSNRGRQPEPPELAHGKGNPHASRKPRRRWVSSAPAPAAQRHLSRVRHGGEGAVNISPGWRVQSPTIRFECAVPGGFSANGRASVAPVRRPRAGLTDPGGTGRFTVLVAPFV